LLQRVDPLDRRLVVGAAADAVERVGRKDGDAALADAPLEVG
jgi:hypothetical protein